MSTEWDETAFEAALKRAEEGVIHAAGIRLRENHLPRLLEVAPDDERLGGPQLSAADFRGASFAARADFGAVTFSGDADFRGVTFSGAADFREATFDGKADFREATFHGYPGFSEATFHGNADFREATFHGDADFREATFDGDAYLNMATFHGDTSFSGATFNGFAAFGGPFSGNADFRYATFNGNAEFAQMTFSGDAYFFRATFSRYAGFGEVTFSRHAGFGEATFSDAYFQEATFSGDADFSEATFSGDANFIRATFEMARELGPILACGQLSLDRAVFLQPVRLELSSRRMSCARAVFHGGADVLVRWADVSLEDADFAKPSLVSELRAHHRPDGERAFLGWEELADDGSWRSRLDDPPEEFRPRVVSLRRAKVAELALSGVDARACRFVGAHGLDELKLERVRFALPPEGWQLVRRWRPVRWTRRQTVAEERHWREEHEHGSGWYEDDMRAPCWLEDVSEPPDAGQIGGVYRAWARSRFSPQF